jgi:DNA-binding transcriptional LysR family regulator
MSKIDDMFLFVQVVKAGGLAVAGRQIGLSPASMTARINAIEQNYNTRLLHRTTRKISLTDAGQRFYEACLRVLAEVENAEMILQNDKVNLAGQLRITAPSDFGRQYVAPALAEFAQRHSAITSSLHLTDGVINLVEHGYDLAIRYGNLPDRNLIVRRLADNYRVLVATPDYLNQYGIPEQPKDLMQHRCLVMERLGEPLNEWRFYFDGEHQTIRVKQALISNDGAIIRQWALVGAGIAYKSVWDVKGDLSSGKLVTVLDGFVVGFQEGDNKSTGLQIIYPSRKYIPKQVAKFIEFFKDYLS